MQNFRKSERFTTSCNVKINVVPKCKFYIKNLSINGCCLKCARNPEKVKINEKYTINIKPEHGSHVHNFDLEVECRWVRNMEDSGEFGFEIISFPKGKNFQSYVDYLSFRSGLPKNQ